MERTSAAHTFATLGHPGRLAVFRMLMRFAPQGVRPTEIATALGLKQNTLSHHLADLTASGLVHVARHGRSLFYSVDLDVTEGLIGYLALDVGRARPDLLGPLLASQNECNMLDTDFDVLFICSGSRVAAQASAPQASRSSELVVHVPENALLTAGMWSMIFDGVIGEGKARGMDNFSGIRFAT